MIAGYPLYVFAVTVDAGVVVAVLLTAWRAARSTLLSRRIHRVLDAAVVTLVAAFAGARLGYVALHLHDYRANPLTALYVWEGGLSWPAASTVGALMAVVMLRRSGLPVGTTLDLAAPGVAIGHGIGLLGCLAAGCAVGRPVAAGSPLPALALADAAGVVSLRFPSPLVEAAAAAVLGIGLWVGPRRGSPPGLVAAGYLAGAGALRLAAEPLRADSTWLGPVAAASVWAAGALLVGGLLLWRTLR